MDDTKTRVAITVSKSFWYKVKLSALSAEMKLSEFVESKLMFAMQCDEGVKYKHERGEVPLIIARKEPTGENIEKNSQKVVNDSYNEQTILAEAQKRLEAKKVELHKSIKTPKGPVKANAAMESFFKPMPKDKQLGKKGAK